MLSSLATLWLAHQDAFIPLLAFNLLIYGSVTYSRNTLTQALVADSMADDDQDTAFGLYHLIEYISGPIWALVAGFIMEAQGFSMAFSVMAISYIAGSLLLFLVKEPPRTARNIA